MLGISADPPERQKKFKQKYDLPFTLLADTDKKVAQAFDVIKEKSLYGRKTLGIERTTFLIDEKGHIQKIFPKVDVNLHYEEVLNALL